METLRQRIFQVLEEADRPLTVDEIGAVLDIPVRERKRLYEELVHLAKTVERKSGGAMRIMYEPPRCVHCGYVFKDLKRIRKPSRCPKCKSERILPPRFILLKK
ncbi:MAG: transcriptional regulator [Thermoprotei archaeon]|nr:MAG: transcriptional regulator [Thermoprotei archaeon]